MDVVTLPDQNGELIGEIFLQIFHSDGREYGKEKDACQIYVSTIL